jgi:hypothetical protein
LALCHSSTTSITAECLVLQFSGGLNFFFNGEQFCLRRQMAVPDYKSIHIEEGTMTNEVRHCVVQYVLAACTGFVLKTA